jgi:hypothetical protein
MLKGASLSVDVNDLIYFLDKIDSNYLEIGCFNGTNLAKLALHYPNKKIYGIDPFISDGYTGTSIHTALNQQQHNLYWNIINLDNVKFFQLTSEQFRELDVDYKKMNIGCIFVDGSHHYKDIVIDIDISINCIKNNKNNKGIIIFHDINIPDVINAISQFKKDCDELKYDKISYKETITRDYNIFEVDFN